MMRIDQYCLVIILGVCTLYTVISLGGRLLF